MMKVWTAFLLIGAAASVVAWAAMLCRENRVCPFGAAARFVRGLPWGGRLAILPLFAALIVYESMKNSGELKVESGEFGGSHGMHEMGTNLDSPEMRRRSYASEGRFGEAEPEGCASIRENNETQRGEDGANIISVGTECVAVYVCGAIMLETMLHRFQLNVIFSDGQ